MDNAFRYIKANDGIDTEESYPYEAKDGQCRFQRAYVGATVTGKIRDYEYEILFKVFCAYCKTIDTSKFFIVLFFSRNVTTVIFIEGGWALSSLQNAKTSNIW